ncbi:sporulation protein YunB [Tepidibacter formicigenes]|uniref:Sporulation protein YunB n=1 Tax=Tepidibacter formicigenes DSM 15518 TaxID=1123349 RepID=A0A1M6NPZ0_9FIRM|nr:sporulation protein YunB [Tepidibacter formicigenes]SHJ97734.1 sporulation protein YunB [Tepidibacter formicigenes DSM 15518]
MKKLLKVKKRRRNRKIVSVIILILLFIIFIGSFIFIDRKIKPTVQAIAESKAQELANRSINKAVGQILQGKIKYEELINLKTDVDGNITMIQANTILMNKIASDVAIEVQQQLKQIKTTSANIPLGTAFKSSILAKYGPKLKVGVQPVGIVNVDFRTEFDSSGINQTRHRIYLIIKTKVRVIIPFTSSYKEVASQMPVCETIIVGKVPQNYVNIPENEVPNIIDAGE